MDTQRIPALSLAFARAIGLLVVLACCLAGCATRGETPLDIESLLGQPLNGAYYRGGQLVLHYDISGDNVFLVADWPVDHLSPDRHDFRMAVLKRRVRPPASPADLQRDWEPVTLLEQARWRALVGALLEHLAPDDPATATLVAVQQADFLLHRDQGGELRVYRRADSPAGLSIGRRLSEEAFSAEANAYLETRLSLPPESAGPMLFAVDGDEFGARFVLFDCRRRQSVFIAVAPGTAPPGQNLDFSLRLFGAVTLRSHVLSPLRQPITTAHRLLWRTAHSGAAVLPRGISSTSTAPALAHREPMDPAQWEAQLDTIVGAKKYRGSMELLIDGEAFFESLVQAIQEAQESVDVRLYIFSRDDYALRIADLLKQRSHEIRVRVLVDRLGVLTAGRSPRGSPYHSRGASSEFIADYLRRDSDVNVRVVDNPWFTSDHTKVIIIDRKRAYVGGMNIGREYRYEWHDMMVEVRGPIVGRLRKDFRKRWAHTGIGGDLAFALAAMKPEKHAGAADGPDYMDIRPLYTRTGDAQILRAQLAAIRRAQSRVYIQQPYVSEDQLIAELIRARHRGVDVRLILPARSDFGLMDSANLITARALINNGIRVYAYPGMTHVKAALYDDWAIVGSANFDKLSLRINQETNLATSDPRFVRHLERELFEVDFARSRELTESAPVGWRDHVARIITKQL
jgi:cardiolipin synthase A/B